MDVLESKERNISWLSKKTGIAYNTIYNFCMRKTNAVNYNLLSSVCVALDCKLEDIIEFAEDEDTK